MYGALQHFEFYPPLFAHQIFGGDESIHGYISPEIDITYSEDSLLPAITFTHIPRRNPDNSPAAIPPGTWPPSARSLRFQTPVRGCAGLEQTRPERSRLWHARAAVPRELPATPHLLQHACLQR